MKALFCELRGALVSTAILAVVTCGIYPVAVWGVGQVAFKDKANGSLITDANGTLRGSSLLGQGFSSDKYFVPRPSSAGTGYDAAGSSGSNLGPTSKKLVNGTVKPTAIASEKPGEPLQPGPEVVEFDGLKLRILSYCEQNGLPYQLLRAGQPVDPKLFKDAQGAYDPVKLINAFNDEVSLTVRAGVPIPADAVTGSASGLDPHISPANARIQAARVAKVRGLAVEKVQACVVENTDQPSLRIFGEPGVNVLRLNLALDALR